MKFKIYQHKRVAKKFAQPGNQGGMNMAKRILAMLLVMAMVFSVMPTGVLAEGEGQGQPAQQALDAHDDSKHKCEHCLKLGKTDAEAIVAWEPWGDTEAERSKLPDGSDGKTHYVLVDNIQVATQTNISSSDITICLNGKQVTTTGNCNTFEMSGTGKVRITDCTASGTLTAKSGKVLVMMAAGDATAQFDLYGGKITGCTGTTGSVARVQGHCTFNMHGGEISGNNGSSGVVYVQNFGTFNMYGGEVKNNTATNGGAFYLTGNRTKLYIEGCKVSGNTATKAGGAIYSAAGTVELKNAEISGNQAAQGGAIELNATVANIRSPLTLDNTKVINNTTTTSFGAISLSNSTTNAFVDVFLKGGTEITGNIFGDPVTSTEERNLYLRDHWITPVAKDLSSNARIGVYVEDSRITATNGKQYLTGALNGVDLSGCFSSDRPEYIPSYTTAGSGRIIMIDKPAPPEHPHKICNDSGCQDGHTDVEFKRWGDTDAEKTSLPTSGSIFLTNDVTLSAPVRLSGTKLNICLNGKTIRVNANGGNVAAFNILGATELNITDCTTDPEKIGKITGATDSVFFTNGGSSAVINLYNGIITENSGTKAGVAFLQANSVLNLYSGKITGNTHAAYLKQDGSAANTWGAPVAAVYYGNAKFNMYGGEISGNTSTAVKNSANETKGGKGGAFYAEGSNTQINIYGGTISGNSADVYGGAIYTYKGKVNLLGGTITGNKAGSGGAVCVDQPEAVLTVNGAEISGKNTATNGGAVYAVNRATVKLQSGKISGNSASAGGGLYVATNCAFNMTGGEITENTSSGSGAGVYHLKSTGTYSGGTISNNEATGSGAAIFNNSGTVTLSGVTISGNTANNNGGAVYGNVNSKTTVQAGQISGNTAKNSGGAIYAGAGAIVDLNGGKLTKNKAGSGGGIYATDAGTVVNASGSEISENEASSGGGMLIASGTVLNLSGGKISGNTAASGAGLYMSKKSTINMTGGEISGNKSTGSGAGVYHLESTGNYTGGSITGNISAYNGGAMFLNGATVTLGSVSITGNEAVGAGGIYVNEKTVLTVTGEPVVQDNIANGKKNNIYLPGKVTFKVDNVGENAKVGLSAAAAFRFVSEANDTDYSKGFVSDRASLQVEYRGQQLYLGASGNHAHCLCDSNITYCTHEEVLFAAWDDPNSLPASGNWYLNTDVTLSKPVSEMRNVTLNLCLNGHTVKMTGDNGQIFDVKGTTNLNITDCAEKSGKITGATNTAIFGNNNATGTVSLYNGIITGNSGKNAGAVFLQTDMTFNMYGGQICDNTSTGSKAGAVNVYNGTTMFNMYGGTISGNAAANGGAVYAEGRNAQVNLFGGKISGNQATDGAGIYMSSRTTFNMTGGEISGNEAIGNGGGLALLRCEATISGGTISENSAKYGGGMLVRGANLYLKGGQIIKNTATNNGGGIKTGNQNAGEDVYTAKIVMSDGIIGENTANYGGGVIVEGAGCEMVMQGGEISKNSANYGGGMFVSTKTVFTMEGGKIANNTAKKTGGGIQMLNSTATFTGGELSGNQCPSTGGAVYVNDKDSVATFDGVKVTKNKGGYGGGACAANRGKIIFKSGTFSNNTAVNNGGGMYISTNSILDMYGGTITGNNVEKDTGGGLYGLRSTMNLYGGTVSYNKSKVGGGGIMVAGATLNLKGANVLYNTALSDSGKGGTGGGVRTNCQTVTKNGVKTEYKAKINMTAGTIKGNECGYGGGGVLVNGVGASMEMSGGVICDNISRDLGGGLYVSNQTTFTMTGGEVCRNKASGDGGGFWLAKNTTHSMANAKIYENTAGKKAGAVYFHNNATCTFTDVEFTKNVSTNGGAIFGQQDMNPIMIRCTFTENESTEYSGGAIFSRYKATIEDCKFVGNKSAGSGGAVYVGQSSLSVNGWGVSDRGDAGIYITNTTFENNTAKGTGGALHIIMSAFTEIKNTTFTGNSSGDAGSAIWAEEDLTMEDVTVTGNKGNDGMHAVYLAASEYDGESYFKGLMKMGGNMIIRDNEGGDLYLAEKTTVTVLGSGFGEKTHIGVTLDSGVLTQRVYGAYNYEGGDCVYTITYGDRSLTDPEIDASLLPSTDDAEGAQNVWLFVGVGAFAVAIVAVAVVLLTRKKKNTAKEAVEE